MWQLISNDYINGMMGNQIDPVKAMKMYWQMMQQYGYPTAKYALAFIEDSVTHLPTDIEKVLVENPEAVQLALSYIQDRQKMAGLGAGGGMATGQQGGARVNAGRDGNGASHSANVEKTNNKNRAQSGAGETNSTATATGGMQGGTNSPAAKVEADTLSGTGQQ